MADIADLSVCLSEGNQQSPFLQSSSTSEQSCQDVCYFDLSKKVRTIAARVNVEADQYYLNEIIFTYEDGSQTQTP